MIFFWELILPEQLWVLQYLKTWGLPAYLQFFDSRKTFSFLSTSKHLIIRFCDPLPHGFEHCWENYLILILNALLIFLTSVHSEICHFGPQSFISSRVQSLNDSGLFFKSHSFSSAKLLSFTQTTVRILVEFEKQSPSHFPHGPIN